MRNQFSDLTSDNAKDNEKFHWRKETEEIPGFIVLLYPALLIFLGVIVFLSMLWVTVSDLINKISPQTEPSDEDINVKNDRFVRATHTKNIMVKLSINPANYSSVNSITTDTNVNELHDKPKTIDAFKEKRQDQDDIRFRPSLK